MRYPDFYRIMKLMVPTGRMFLGSMLFVILHMFIGNLFLSEPGVTTVGLSALFMMAVFIMSGYARQMRFDPLCPIWDYPMTTKERVTYVYISIFVTFLGTLLFFIVVGLLIGGLVTLLGNVLVTEGESIQENIAGDLYTIGWNLLMMSWVFPLSYVEKDRNRTVLVFLGYVVFGLSNLVLGTLLTGKLFFRNDVRLLFVGQELALVLTILFVMLGILSIFFSYRAALRMHGGAHKKERVTTG
jgi:hypothetical protein